MKIYIASDFHIGSEDANYEAIMGFFDIVKRDADELILLGDVLDLWRNTFENITTQEPYKSAYNALIDVSRVVPTTIVRGNHDHNISKKIKGTTIKFCERFTRNNIRFMHGWEFDLMQIVAHPWFMAIAQYFPYFYQKFIYKPRAETRYALSFSDIVTDNAEKFLKKKGFTCLIYGHEHTPFIKDNLMNCGDMVGNHSSYIVINNGMAQLWHIPATEKKEQ